MDNPVTIEAAQLVDDLSGGYEVDLPTFQGPLDILLDLIEQEELDITKISLAQVTDQYLAHLGLLKEADPDDLTDFLMIAAKLILIKSEVLLPRPPPILANDKEEDVGDELARQLILYKKFKEIAAELRSWEDKNERSYVREVPTIKVEPQLKPGEGSLAALLAAARRAMAIKPEDPVVDEVVSPQMVTIGEQMVHIWREIDVQEAITFRRLLRHDHNRIEVIVTLLAILELIKRRVIAVQQHNPFGDILIHKRPDIRALDDSVLEELVGMTDLS